MNKKLGFTIIELMITVAMVAVISAFASPSLIEFLERREVTQQASVIQDAFSLARSTALSSGGAADVCWNIDGVGSANATLDSIVVIDTSNANTVIKTSAIQPPNYKTEVTNVAGGCVTYTAQGRASGAVDFGVCRIEGNLDNLLTIRVAANGRATMLRQNPNNFTCQL